MTQPILETVHIISFLLLICNIVSKRFTLIRIKIDLTENEKNCAPEQK